MEGSTVISIIFAVLTIFLVGAWIGGYLDKYQKIAQDKALDAMGENRASYGVKGIRLQTGRQDYSALLTV